MNLLFTSLPSVFNQCFSELTMLSASVDKEDRREEEKDDEAAEGGDKDDSGVWRERSRTEKRFDS